MLVVSGLQPDLFGVAITRGDAPCYDVSALQADVYNLSLLKPICFLGLGFSCFSINSSR